MKKNCVSVVLLTFAVLASVGSPAHAQKKKSPAKPATTATPSGKKVTIVDHPKHHNPTDTVGVVNGTVINYADFNSMMSGYLKLFVKRTGDNVVTDSLYSVIVDSAWDKAVEDILVEQTIQERRLSLTDSEAIAMIVSDPPEFLAKQVTDASGKVHTEALRQALTDPRNDSISQVIVQGERMRLENQKFLAAIAPNATTPAARERAYAAWLRKARGAARIEDRRLAFGFY